MSFSEHQNKAHDVHVTDSNKKMKKFNNVDVCATTAYAVAQSFVQD